MWLVNCLPLVFLHFTQVFVEKYMALRYRAVFPENIKMSIQAHGLELPPTALATEKERDCH